jgi:EAL and modified HD-GYP domain-containing signal transduction protein
MDVFVARQPIFDRESRVHAYELLYRADADFNQFTGKDEDRPTLEVIAGSLLTIGLNSIVGGKKAFINFGRNLLVDGLVSLLPRDSVVIEVLETAQPDAQVLNTCRELRKLGYTIALDDFAWHPQCEQLVEIAHMIKIDVRSTSRAEQERLVATYQPRGVQMLAEKVETREEFEWAANLGYDYFQGYFFARPSIISAKEIQPGVFTCLQLLKELQSPEPDFKKLESLISADVGLAYKLFRYVNSVLFARRGNIQSIRRALVHLGADAIRRWATVATLPRLLQDKPEELVASALVRAHFCENLARLAGDPGYPSAYLTGLFSFLDALLDRPLQEALAEVGLGPHINDVLLGAPGSDEPLATIYSLVRSYETGEWEHTDQLAGRLSLADFVVSNSYVEATERANHILAGWRSESNQNVRPAPTKAALRKERRRHKRDPIAASLTVLWGRNPQEEKVTQATILDISAFGARFRLSSQVPPGSWLMFNHHKIGISGRGTVRHCRLVKSVYEIGVEFTGGTGWDAVSQRVGTELRNLNDAIGRLETVKLPDIAIAGNGTMPIDGAKNA